MLNDRVDVLVIGTGLCGLAIAVTAARRGLSVRCIGDGRPGASLSNFGQLHSGAVYAPVLPDVAQACWQHRERWRDLAAPARVGQPYGMALFHGQSAVERYRTAWHRLGIDVHEIDPRTAEPRTRAVAAFRIPDHSVHLPTLHKGLYKLAEGYGVRETIDRNADLRREPTTGLVAIGASTSPAMVVLATGADTPALLTRAGIAHSLKTRRIAWGRLRHAGLASLTYWLDGDLLALSPDRDSLRVGLPGAAGEYRSAEIEHERLYAALAQRGLALDAKDVSLQWGGVCEPARVDVDTSALVIDLRNPPPGWTPTANLVVALPGKWTTAWQCADQVVGALS